MTTPHGFVLLARLALLGVGVLGASRTDSREGRFWELLVHDPDGRPLLDALEQRFNDHMGRDMSEVLATARTMTRIYSDTPLSWSALRAAEGWVGSKDDEKARNARHLARVVTLDRTLREAPNPSAADVGNLFFSARVLGAEEIASYWRARLLADHPTTFFAVQERLRDLYRDYGDDPAKFLAALEPMWRSATGQRARRPVVTLGFQFARQAGDPEAILRWLDRYVATEPGQTAAEHEATVAQQVAELRAALGDALLAAGHAGEAIIELEQATATGWNADWLRAAADRHHCERVGGGRRPPAGGDQRPPGRRLRIPGRGRLRARRPVRRPGGFRGGPEQLGHAAVLRVGRRRPAPLREPARRVAAPCDRAARSVVAPLQGNRPDSKPGPQISASSNRRSRS